MDQKLKNFTIRNFEWRKILFRALPSYANGCSNKIPRRSEQQKQVGGEKRADRNNVARMYTPRPRTSSRSRSHGATFMLMRKDLHFTKRIVEYSIEWLVEYVRLEAEASPGSMKERARTERGVFGEQEELVSSRVSESLLIYAGCIVGNNCVGQAIKSSTFV